MANLKASSSQGIPRSHIENTVSLPYNNIELLEKTIRRHKTKIACVILEPVAGNMGVIRGSIKFLKALRMLTKKYKIVLIFDEIMTGFRASAGCVQSDIGIIPDMTCLGKIIGGGFSVGAYGGRKDIMKHLAPLGGVYQAGTFSGNPIVMRAGLATLKQLTKGFYKDLNAKSETFADDLNRVFDAQAVDAHLSRYFGMMSLRFRSKSVHNYNDAKAASSDKKYSKLFHHLLKDGIYLPPADLEAFFISGQHSQNDLNRLLKSLKAFFV